MPPNLCTLGEAWNAVCTTVKTVVTIVIRKIMELAECWGKNESNEALSGAKTKNKKFHTALKAVLGFRGREMFIAHKGGY